MDPIRRRVVILGRVQGVSFRASTLDQVRRRDVDLRGYVRNLPNGHVEAVFQGPAAQVLELVSWCQRGPAAAMVKGLEVSEEPPLADEPPFRITV